MKSLNILLLTSIFISLKSNCQTDIVPKNFINPSYDLNGGNAYTSQMAITNSGFTYTVGSFINTIDFDITKDTFNLSSTYKYNMFIAKYDKQSRLVFAFKLNGISGFDNVTAITTDKEDNIYVAGFFARTVDFDPGPGIAQLSTPNDYTYNFFFAKYDKNGKYVFVKPGEFNSNLDRLGEIRSIKVDNKSNILIAGFGKTRELDFDPGSNIVHAQGYGKQDIFFAQYNASGNYVFVKTIGSNEDDYCSGFSLNKNGDILIAGYFSGAVNDFDPAAGKIVLGFEGGIDAFVGIYNSAGSYKNAFAFGNINNDGCNAITADNDSNIIVTGTFYGSVDFDPDSSSKILSSNINYDYFLPSIHLQVN